LVSQVIDHRIYSSHCDRDDSDDGCFLFFK
jgi:hypothetical protein